QRLGLHGPEALATPPGAGDQPGRLQQLQVLAGRLPRDRNDADDLRCRTRTEIAEPDDDAQSIGVPERVKDRRAHRELLAHTRRPSAYLRTRSAWMAQPSELASNDAKRRTSGIASNPDSVMVSSTPSGASDRVNSTSVVGSWS